MSCIQNEAIQEQILEDLESTSLHEFQELLSKHNYNNLNNEIDSVVADIVQILFDERCV